jgi:hypothetical protein
MHTISNRLSGPLRLLAVAALVAAGAVPAARAAMISYSANLTGANESPPNASPGSGIAQVDVDDVAHTMHVVVSFSGLSGATTASHIHAATTVAGTGTAGVATTTPTFAGFPLGVTAGAYDATLDLTQASSYNASFVTAHGGTPAGAEAFLLQSLAAGKAYLNIHSLEYGGGEIRGFLTVTSVPVSQSTWGQTKSSYR